MIVLWFSLCKNSRNTLLVVLPLSISSALNPPELYPGHGHQNVANPGREGRSRDNSWLQFNGFIQTNRGTASPTQPQSVGGNYSPTNALRPRTLTYINYSSTISHYIYSQVLAPIIYPRSSPITFHIIHISSPYYKCVRFRQERRLDCLCGTRAFPPRPNHADRPTNQRARLPSPGLIVRMSEPISGLILVHMSTVLLLQWHPCRISRRPPLTQVA